LIGVIEKLQILLSVVAVPVRVAEKASYTREDLTELEVEIRKLNSSIAQNEYICNSR
jgi:hypothetical protein